MVLGLGLGLVYFSVLVLVLVYGPMVLCWLNLGCDGLGWVWVVGWVGLVLVLVYSPMVLCWLGWIGLDWD